MKQGYRRFYIDFELIIARLWCYQKKEFSALICFKIFLIKVKIPNISVQGVPKLVLKVVLRFFF